MNSSRRAIARVRGLVPVLVIGGMLLGMAAGAAAGTQGDFAGLAPASPDQLNPGDTQAQTFTVTHSFDVVGALTPTWGKTNSAVTFVLASQSAPSTPLAKHTFVNIQDGAYLELVLAQPAAPGAYILTEEDPVGTVGWWTSGNTTTIPGAQALTNGKPSQGERVMHFLASPDVQHFSQLFNDLPAALVSGHTLGEEFATAQAFTSVAIPTPTWGDKTAGVTVELLKGGPGGSVLVQKTFTNVPDGGPVILAATEPAGDYTLVESQPVGTIGWYSSSIESLPNACSLVDGAPVQGERLLTLTYTGASSGSVAAPPCVAQLKVAASSASSTSATTYSGSSSTTGTAQPSATSGGSSSSVSTAGTLPKTGDSGAVPLTGLAFILAGVVVVVRRRRGVMWPGR